MGCCFSRPEGPNSPYPGGAPSGSARAINVPAGAASSTGGMSAGGVADDPGTPTPGTPSLRPRTGSPSAHIHRMPLPRPLPPLAQHINKPLRRRRWTSRSRVWTRHTIDRERVDFFDTRVTGRAEIWQTLHAALELLWEADLLTATRSKSGGGSDNNDNNDNDDADDDGSPAAGQSSATTPTRSDAEPPRQPVAVVTVVAGTAEAAEAVATAQSMLDAADITLPTGDLAQGAYDAFGNFYSLPSWIVSDPANLDTDPAHDLADAKRDLDDGDEDEEDEEEGSNDADYDDGDDADDDDISTDGTFSEDAQDNSEDGHGHRYRHRHRHRHPSLRRRREEKGKAVVVAADLVAVRARLSATSRDVVIHLGRDETVRSLVHRISEEAKLPHKTRIRIAYLGKILKESTSLTAQGWKEGHVVNALVFDLS